MLLSLENNSGLDGFHYTKEELQVVFERNPNVEQLLDIAPIDNYEHLEQIISVKYPIMLYPI